MSTTNFKNYKQGFLTGSSIAIGYIPLGISFGILSKNFGMNPFLSFFMSLVNYAGASQFISTKLMFDGTSRLVEIIVAVAILNSRYSLLNLLIYQKLNNSASKKFKALIGIGLTDETISYLSFYSNNSPFFMLGINTPPYFAFGFGTLAGSLFGGILPMNLSNSLNIILYALFLGLLVPSLKNEIKYLRIVILTIFIKLIFYYVPIVKDLSNGWKITISILLATLIYSQLFYKEEEEKNG